MNELTELIRNLEVFNRPEDLQAIVAYAQRREIEHRLELDTRYELGVKDGEETGYDEGVSMAKMEWRAEKDDHQTKLDEAFENGRRDAIKNPHLCKKLIAENS